MRELRFKEKSQMIEFTIPSSKILIVINFIV
jgi:hypothetical protein